jgi:hypothetical protein
MGRSLHLDRRRIVVLGAAGAFIVIAIVFGALAYFQPASQPSGVAHVSATVTNIVTVSPSPESSPAGGETITPPAPAAVVTVTSTKIISVPQASTGSDVGAIESGASTLATVVAAGCAVIALRPQRRGVPSAPPVTAAAAADAAPSTPGA